MSDLEKIARKATELVNCENNECELYGEYWRCYTNQSHWCPIYLHWAGGKPKHL